MICTEFYLLCGTRWKYLCSTKVIKVCEFRKMFLYLRRLTEIVIIEIIN